MTKTTKVCVNFGNNPCGRTYKKQNMFGKQSHEIIC